MELGRCDTTTTSYRNILSLIKYKIFHFPLPIAAQAHARPTTTVAGDKLDPRRFERALNAIERFGMEPRRAIATFGALDG